MTERRLSRHLTRNLDPNAVDEVWDRLEIRRGRSRRALAGWALAGAAALTCVLVFLSVRKTGGAPAAAALHLASGEAVPASLERPREVALDDGSHLTLEEGASVAPVLNDGRAFALTQRAGAITFDVKPHGPRAWSIDAGLLRVAVLGTRFRVVRGAHSVKVDVERGLVLVTSERLEGGERRLTAGQSLEVRDDLATGDVAPVKAPPGPSSTEVSPAGGPTSAAPSASPPAPSTPSGPSTSSTAHAAHAASWKPLVAKGDYRAAYEALGHENLRVEAQRATSAEELLQISDVARLSGHPAEAVAPLERLLAVHAGDPRASTAAFTLGKVQLDSLSAPGPAARAFERAIALGLPGALREDAFARRVEAYAKTGDVPGARAARTAYEQAFAAGRHRAAVERWAP